MKNNQNTPIFERYDDGDVRNLVDHYPLAWMYIPSAPQVMPIELPLIGEYDSNGVLVALIGHFGKKNPIHLGLHASQNARFLFRGPESYISPEHAGRRNWGPTWNFAHLIVDADVVVDSELTDYSLGVLVAAMESGRSEPWSAGEMGERYNHLKDFIIGFRATVLEVNCRLKLGQDENIDVLKSIISIHPDKKLSAWMENANADRI